MPSRGFAVFQTMVPPARSSNMNSHPKPLAYTMTAVKVVMAKKRRMSVVYEVEDVRVT